jgi:hypothetical protein
MHSSPANHASANGAHLLNSPTQSRPHDTVTRPKLAIVLITLAAAPAASGSAAAAECSHRQITAQGAPASFAFLARSRAKAAWRAAVTQAEGLGADYAVWGIAEARSFTCTAQWRAGAVLAEQTCIASAAPCRFD